MKALILTSNGLRHRYFARAIHQHFDAPVALMEAKKNYYTQQQEQSEQIRQHFANIALAEKSWFPTTHHASGPEFREVADINAPALIDWAKAQKFELLCLFGTAILREGWLNAFPDRIINLHLGLSPFYRGSATLFWPFANRELQYLGTTIHLAVAQVDAGAIVERIDANLVPGEDYYAITNRLIRDSIDRFPLAIAEHIAANRAPIPQEKISGKLYRKADFSEEALRMALDYVGSGITADEIHRIDQLRACRYSQ